MCYIIFKRYPGNKRRTIHNFTLNLAFSDLLVLFIYLPSQLHLFETNMKWKIGEVMCRITYLIVPLSIYSSIGTLIAISRDRYYAVIHPMTSLDRRNTKPPLICIWVASFLFTIPLILVSKIERGYCTEVWPTRFLSHVYWIVAFCAQFAIPVCLLAVAHASIVIHLKRLKLPSEANHRSRVRARQRQQQRMIVMSITLVLAYVVCMLPQHLIFFWMSFGDLQSQPYNMYIFQVSNLMQILNSALNPVVYGTLNNDIKRGFISAFRCGSQARSRLPYWKKRTIELQTIASSYYTSPVMPRQLSRLTINSSERYERDGSYRMEPKGRHYFNRQRSLRASEYRRKSRGSSKFCDEESAMVEKECNGNDIIIS